MNHSSSSTRYIKSITKVYKNYEKVIVYKNAYKTPEPKTEEQKKRTNETRIKNRKKILSDKDYQHKVYRAVQRSQSTISDIVSCNSFDYFITLTISPKNSQGVNRYDYDQSSKAITKWLRYACSQYILVPEKHKDGAYHFHLLANLNKTHLKKLVHFKKTTYNIPTYTLGYSTAIQITKGSEDRLANYIKKYITKQLLHTVGFERKRFWTSRGLNRPKKLYNSHKKIDNPKPTLSDPRYSLRFTTDYISIYHAPRSQDPPDSGPKNTL